MFLISKCPICHSHLRHFRAEMQIEASESANELAQSCLRPRLVSADGNANTWMRCQKEFDLRVLQSAK